MKFESSLLTPGAHRASRVICPRTSLEYFVSKHISLHDGRAGVTRECLLLILLRSSRGETTLIWKQQESIFFPGRTSRSISNQQKARPASADAGKKRLEAGSCYFSRPPDDASSLDSRLLMSRGTVASAIFFPQSNSALEYDSAAAVALSFFLLLLLTRAFVMKGRVEK